MLPDLQYEQACRDYLHALLCGTLHHGFLPELVQAVQSLASAADANSLTQTLMRLTCPGIPDLYQGCELPDLSLVDPDNRRAVDLALRRTQLESGAATKQQLIKRVLAYRGMHAPLFAEAGYLPLEVVGPCRRHVVAFARCLGDTRLISAGIRLPYSLRAQHGSDNPWLGTRIVLPRDWACSWENILNPDLLEGSDALPLERIFSHGTVALLQSQ